MTKTKGEPNAKLSPRFVSGRRLRIAGLAGRYGNANRDEIPELWARFGPKYFGRLPGQVDRKAYGVCSNMDANGNLDYLAGVEVSSFGALPGELTQLTIEPQWYAVFAHEGHISEIGRSWMAIFDGWLPKSGCELASAPSFECYGEDFDPAVAIGNVEIWIAVKV